MQKFISVLLIVFMCGFAEISFAATPVEANMPATAPTGIPFFGKNKNKKNRAGKRKKNGRYKKSKGLFGKKNGCGCPNN